MIVNDHNIYKLSNIVRYCQKSKIKHETVAEHSFYVGWFILKLCRQYKIPDDIKLLALETGLLHDIPEIITNDITYDVKKMIPEIPKLLQPYEEEIIGEHSKVAQKSLYNPETPAEIIANRLVAHADNLSVFQYCEHEERFGNKNFIILKNDSLYRVARSRYSLEEAISKYLGGNENAKE